MFPNKIGIGKLQFFGRYEKWNFAQLSDVYDQNITWKALGVNYYLKGQDLRLTFEYSANDFAQQDALNKDFNTVTVMFQLRI